MPMSPPSPRAYTSARSASTGVTVAPACVPDSSAIRPSRSVTSARPSGSTRDVPHVVQPVRHHRDRERGCRDLGRRRRGGRRTPDGQREQGGKKSDSHEIHGAESVGVPRYRLAMPPSYLRHPHLHGDTLVFVAEDDVWTAPVDGGRAYRLTADGVPVARPRISPGRRPRGVDVDAGAGAGGVRHRGRRRRRAAAHLVGRPHHEADRLDARGRGAGGERGRAAVAGATRGRTPSRRAEARPGGCRSARWPIWRSAPKARRVLLSATMTREMAWRKRYRGGTAGKLWWNPEGDVRAARRRPRRQPRRADAGRRPDRVPLRPRGLGQPLLARRAGGADLRRHTDHGATTAGGAPAFYARHAATDGTRVVYESAGQLWLLDDLDGEPRRLDVALGGPRTAREPYRITTGEWLSSRAAPTAPAGPASSASAAPCTGSPTATARPARCSPSPACGPGSPRRWARTARCGSTTRSARTPCASPRSTRAPRSAGRAAVRPRARPRAGARARARRRERRAHHPRRPAAAARRRAGELRELARGGDGEIHDLAFSPDSAWLAYCDPVGLRPHRRSCSCGWPTARRCRSPRAASATPTRCSPSTASTWRSCRCAASTRSTTSTRSTSRSPRPGGRSWCRSARARRRRSGRARTGARSRRSDDSRRTRPRSTRRDPGDDDATQAPAREEEGRRGRPRSSSTSRGSPTRVVPVPVVEGRYRGMTRGQGLPALVPRCRSTARSATAARAPT